MMRKNKYLFFINKLILCLTILYCIPIIAKAEIIADPHAIKNQQPEILNTANELPQVNIQTPNASGISRNAYQKFDVNHEGSILNNSQQAVQTQLSGWIQGNPFLKGQSARIILNEVNSNNPSLLNGYLEVAGNKAQIVIANPSGIRCDGCGFINVNHVVLTTGVPIFDRDNLNGYLIERGTINIEGKGLDTKLSDYTEIISRAVKINANILANDLKITTDVLKENSDNAEKPKFSIDTSQLGGMYAGKITLLATEAGVGVRNAGYIGASSGEVILSANGKLENSGQITSATRAYINTTQEIENSGVIQASENIQLHSSENIKNINLIDANNKVEITVAGNLDNKGEIRGESETYIDASEVKNTGKIYAKENIFITTRGNINNEGIIASLNNTQLLARGDLNNRGGEIVASGENNLQINGQIINNQGNIESGKNLNIDAEGISGDGKFLSGENISIKLKNDFINTSEIHANGSITLKTLGKITNLSNLIAQILELRAAIIDNTQNGKIAAKNARIIAEKMIINHGLIDGSETYIQTNNLINRSTGRLYGDNLMVNANVLTNDSDNNQAAVIAARQRLNIATQSLTNNEHALIFSVGDMSISGDFNLNTEANSIDNKSAIIEALGNLSLFAKKIRNINLHFNTETQEISRKFLQDYQLSGSPNRYDREKISLTLSETWFLNTPEGFGDDFVRYDYTRSISETKILKSDPGKILAHGILNLTADYVLNDKSQIMAGSDFIGNVSTLNNMEISGQRKIVESGGVNHFFRIKKPGPDFPGEESSNYQPPAVIEAFKLHPSIYRSNTKIQDSNYKVNPITEIKIISDDLSPTGMVIRTGAVNTQLPNSVLFQINYTPENSQYLIETDPRFSNYRIWLSSDYMLRQLGVDSSLIQKRLGDGFYEQRLIREQVAQLTGKEFLTGYNDDEEEYRALMDNGLSYYEKWKLRPGIELTKEQMMQLTTDIVWLVEKEIKLSDGHTTRILVPQIYARVKENEVTADGALISGNRVQLNLKNDLTNSGTFAAQNKFTLSAENILNIGGRFSSLDSTLYARKNLDNFGGIFDAQKNLNLLAGHDVHIVSTTHHEKNKQGDRTNIERVAGVSVSDAESRLKIYAGNDIDLNAAKIINSGQGGVTTLTAGHDLNLSTVKESQENHVIWSTDSQRHDTNHQEIGSYLQMRGDLNLLAGNNLTAKGVTIENEKGTLRLDAANNINLIAAKSNQSLDESHKSKGSNSFFSKEVITTRDSISKNESIGSKISAKSIQVQAGKYLDISGSHIIADQNIHLLAGNDIRLNASKNTQQEEHFWQKEKHGIFKAEGEQIGFTVGSQKQNLKTHQNNTTTVSAIVGSLEGNVDIKAANNYQQMGSAVFSSGGDVGIQAKKIAIKNDNDISDRIQEGNFEQTGLSLTFAHPISNAIQNIFEVKNAADKTDNLRMQALAGMTAGIAIKNAADAVKKDPKRLGGLQLSFGFDKSKKQTYSRENKKSVVGSTIVAGHDVHLTAKGFDKNSDITIEGSDVHAAHDLELKADDAIKLIAAENILTGENKNKTKSVSVGASAGFSALGTSISLDNKILKSKDEKQSKLSTWKNTVVNADNEVILDSASSTILKGATVSGDKITAHIAGNLDIESLQDSDRYKHYENTAGASSSVAIYGVDGFGVSGNSSKTNIDSNFTSVNQQSGIQAGNQGFQIEVEGNTNLVGAVISSTEQAAQAAKNILYTKTITANDMKNQAAYYADSSKKGVGYSLGDDVNSRDQTGKIQSVGAQIPGSLLPEINGISATSPVTMHASDKIDSITKSGISTAHIIIKDAEKQKQISGKDSVTILNELNHDVSADKNTSNALTPIFKEEVIKAGFEITGSLNSQVGTYLENRAKESSVAQKALDQERQKPFNQQDSEKIARLTHSIEENKTWEMGGTGRRIATALTAAANGNINGSGVVFIQDAASHYLQSLEANRIKKIADALNSETARVALHSVLACGGALQQGQNCATAATGAGASVVLNNLMDSLNAKDASKLTPREKQARTNIVGEIIAGITAVAGGESAVANAAARIETENNSVAFLLMPPPPIPIQGGVSNAAGPLGGYAEINALKKYLDSWILLSEIASNVINPTFNDKVKPPKTKADSPAVEEQPDRISVSQKARRHILDGDGEEGGGGHRAGTGKPGKSEFPRDWSDEKIIKEVSDIASDPNVERRDSYEGRTIKRGTRDGIDINVVFDPKGRVMSAYPTNVPRNPWKKK